MTPNEFFEHDLFATGNGVELIEIGEGYSKTRLLIKEEHLNAGNRTQGGAIFTLADLALAAAANSHGQLAFSQSANISFFRGSVQATFLLLKPANVILAAAQPFIRWILPTRMESLWLLLNRGFSVLIKPYLLVYLRGERIFHAFHRT